MPQIFGATGLPPIFLLLATLFAIVVGTALPTDAAPPAVVPVSLQLSAKNIHDATLRRVDDNTWEIRTTGSDPYLFTEPLPASADVARQHVLAFEYFSTTGSGGVQVFLDPPLSEARSVTGAALSRSEGWSRYAVDLNPARGEPAAKITALRLDPGSESGRVIQIRALELRARTPQEERLAQRLDAHRESEKRREKRLRDHLRHVYPSRVRRVAVDDARIQVSGTVRVGTPNQALFVAEIPLWHDVTQGKTAYRLLTPIRPDARGRFETTIPRRDPKQGDAPANRTRDRLLSRWAVVGKSKDRYELLSQARYPDTVQSRSPNLPEEKPRNKKGIGGLAGDRPMGDLTDLGLSAATVNIVVNGLVATTPGTGRTPFVYAGRTWYADDGQIAELDRTMLEAAKHRLVVSAIVLVGQGANAPVDSFSHRIAHPDAEPAGIFVMPDVSSEAGLTAYAAVMDFLAERYSRKDGRYGRIHHWILHNEVNAGWVWTNAGEKIALLYMDLYTRSMRTVYLIARQYDPHARVFISLEHHWNMQPQANFYKGRDLLEILSDFSAAEGDFDWGIAFHPYPQNLFDPRVWKDNEVGFSFDTPKITFKNLEVLDAWVKLPRMRYEGKRPRTVHLSEQGLNSPDYGEGALRDQAAGMAYAWNKFKNLDTVEVFHYHNWVDNRYEGGLRIGLRKFPDEPGDPLGRKPIWFVYQSLGTDREETVNAPYKSVVGVQEWDEVRHAVPVVGRPPER
ncbi:MAG: hypothetical protein H7145_13875 [Akkermansiaceae bacterium]|nr:hypothetical protein [Armatimonadota bacterium]